MNETMNNKILVIEDNDNLLEMLVTVLSDEGYQVESATNGSEAWQLMQSNNYALLATDLYMPQMNGIELILASQKSLPKTKIILFSGGGRDIEAENGSNVVEFDEQELTVDCFLKKPCNLAELLDTVEELLQDSL